MIQHTSIRLSNSIKDNKARFLVGDFNLAMPEVANSLRVSGVDCVLLEYHVELETKNDDGNLSIVKDSDGNATLLFDTVGIWSLGPMGLYGCISSSVWAHVLGGLTHPFPNKEGKNSRGFSKKAHWKGVLPCIKLPEKAVEVCEQILGILSKFNGDQQQLTQWERQDLPDFLRACGMMEMPNDREKRGEGVGFRDIHIHQPGLRF